MSSDAGVAPGGRQQNPADPEYSNRIFYIGLIAISFAGLLVRAYALGKQALWSDEAMNAFVAQKATWHAIFTIVPLEPLHIFMLKFWQGLGQSSWWLRLPSLFFGFATIPTLGLFGQKIAGSRAGLVVAFLAALHPFLTFYSQDAKMYAWLAFFYTVMIAALAMYSASNRDWQWLAIYIASAVALGYLHRLAGIYIAFVSLAYLVFLARDCRKLVKWLVAEVVIFVLCLPYVVAIALQVYRFPDQHFWAPQPSLWSVYITFSNFAVGYTPVEALRIAGIIVLAILVVSAFVFSRASKRTLWFLAAAAAGPIIFLYIYSLYARHSLYVDRYMITSFVVVLFLAGTGLSALAKRWTLVLALIPIAAAYGYGLNDVYQRNLPQDGRKSMGVFKNFPTNAIVDAVRDRLKPGDRMFHVCRHTLPEKAWHLPEIPHTLIDANGVTAGIAARVAKPAEVALFGMTPVEMDFVEAPSNRFWLVVPEPGAYGYAGIQPEIFPWMLERGELVWSKHFGGDSHHSTWLYLFDPDSAKAAPSEVTLTLPAIAKAHHPEAKEAGDAAIHAAIMSNKMEQERNGEIRSLRARITAYNNRDAAQTLFFTVVEGGTQLNAARFSREKGAASEWNLRMFRDRWETRLAMHCATAEASSREPDPLSATIELRGGRYAVFVERVFEGNNYRAPCADLSITIGDERFRVPGTYDREQGGWDWSRAGEFDYEGGGPVAVEIVAEPKRGAPESFASFGRLLFLRETTGADYHSQESPVLARSTVPLDSTAPVLTALDFNSRSGFVTLIGANEQFSTVCELAPE